MNSRNKIRRWVGLATSLTLITVLAAAVPTTAQRAPTDQDLRQAQHFREAFGLGHSMAIVRESFADPDAYPDLSNGIPLSREEAGELDRRQALFLDALPAIDFAKTLDGFAESHLDQRRGGIPVFYFTGDIEARREAIAEVMPEDIDFDVIEVEFTSRQLRQKQHHVTEDMIAAGWVLAGDIPVVQVADGVVENRVLVGLLRAEDEERARAILQERYGPMVDVEYIGPSQQDLGATEPPPTEPVPSASPSVSPMEPDSSPLDG
jgi:hypothetical protein